MVDNRPLTFYFTRSNIGAPLMPHNSISGQFSMPQDEWNKKETINKFIKEHDNLLYLVKKISIESRPDTMIYEVEDNIKRNGIEGLLNTCSGSGFNIEFYNDSQLCLICGEFADYKRNYDNDQLYCCKSCGKYKWIENSNFAIAFMKRLMLLPKDQRYLISAKIQELNSSSDYPWIMLHNSNHNRNGNDDYMIFINNQHSSKKNQKDLIVGTNDMPIPNRKQKLLKIISYFLEKANNSEIGCLIDKPLFSQVCSSPTEVDNLIDFLVQKSFITKPSQDKFDVSLEYADFNSAEDVYNLLTRVNNIPTNVTNNFNGKVDSVNIGDSYTS